VVVVRVLLGVARPQLGRKLLGRVRLHNS
jgi:hypothetical protein